MNSQSALWRLGSLAVSASDVQPECRWFEPGVRFSKLPKPFRARKAMLCAGYLPTEI